MGLIRELERNGARRSSNRQKVRRFYQMPDGRALTPQQFGRERRQQRRQGVALIIGAISWIPTLLTLGTYWLILTVPLGALFTVLALSIGFAKSDTEVKRHSWKAWREYKSYVLELVRASKDSGTRKQR